MKFGIPIIIVLSIAGLLVWTIPTKSSESVGFGAGQRGNDVAPATLQIGWKEAKGDVRINLETQIPEIDFVAGKNENRLAFTTFGQPLGAVEATSSERKAREVYIVRRFTGSSTVYFATAIRDKVTK